MLQELLEQVAEIERFKDYQIEEGKNVTQEGFMGNVTKIQLNGKRKDEEEMTLGLVIKTATKNVIARNKLLTAELFQREIFLYSIVFPRLEKFLKDKHSHIRLPIPNYYCHSNEEMNEILVLNDLSQDGFKLHDKRKAMNEEHILIVLKHYATLHAISLAFQDQNPNEYQQLKSGLDNIYLKQIKSANLGRLLHFFSETALQGLSEEKYMKRYLKFSEGVGEFFDNCVEEEVENSVLLHGDCWNNNFMFAYQGETPREMRFLDFQFSRIGNPTLDLSFFLYCCAPESVLSNVEEYITFYHDILCSILEKFGSNPQIFPREKLMGLWKKFASFGLALSAFSFYLSLAESEELYDMNEISEEDFSDYSKFKMDFANKDAYLDRMRINIMQCVDKNYI